MAQDKIIDQFNHLVRINKDAEAGFRTAADEVKNTELETLFVGYAKQHAKFAAELQGEIKRMGGEFSDSGTVGGAMHRGWMDLKSALTGHSAGAILASCETGEQSAESAYLDVLELHASGQTHGMLDKHVQQIKGFRTRLQRLVGETKDGVEFQTNE